MKEREKYKGGKDEEVNGQGGRGVPRPHTDRSKIFEIQSKLMMIALLPAVLDEAVWFR